MARRIGEASSSRPNLTPRGRLVVWGGAGALALGAIIPTTMAIDHAFTHKETAGCELIAPEYLRHSTDEFTVWGLAGEIAGEGDNQITADDNIASVNPSLNFADVNPGMTDINIPQEDCAQTGQLYPGDVQQFLSPSAG